MNLAMTCRTAAGLGLVVVCLAPTAAGGQAPGEPPRTAWGVPDLGGIWDFRTMTPLERPEDLGDTAVWSVDEAAAYQARMLERRAQDPLSPRSVHAAWWLDNGTELTEDRRTSLIYQPTNGRIPPLTAEAKARQEAHGRGRPVRLRQSRNSPAHGPEDLGVGERCLSGFSTGPPITPSAYNNHLMVFQTPDHVVLLTEMVHEARIVPLDGRAHLPERIRGWLGDSRGRWDGDTLVIESTNFTSKTGSFNTLGNAVGSGETLFLTERLTRLDDDTLLYEFTVEDPDTFTSPFAAAIPMRRTDQPMYEFACHEGNRGLEGILRGARARERAAGRADRAATAPDDTASTARGGAAADVLALEREIEAAVVRGDVAFVDAATAPTFTFTHGDGWTSGGAPLRVDSRADWMATVARAPYAARVLDAVQTEVHGDIVITYGRYVGRFKDAPPGRRTFTVWYQRVYAKRNGRWQYLSHRTVDGPTYRED